MNAWKKCTGTIDIVIDINNQIAGIEPAIWMKTELDGRAQTQG